MAEAYGAINAALRTIDYQIENMYKVIPGLFADRIDDQEVINMTYHWISHSYTVRGGYDRLDAYRKSYDLKNDQDWLDAPWLADIQSIIKEQFRLFEPKVTLNDPSVLMSVPGCGKQRWHYDFDTDPPYFHPTVKSYSVMLGLQNNTKLDIFDQLTNLEHQIIYNKGDLLIFRGDLIHAGSAYDNWNTRVHWYADYEGNGREKCWIYYAVFE